MRAGATRYHAKIIRPKHYKNFEYDNLKYHNYKLSRLLILLMTCLYIIVKIFKCIKVNRYGAVQMLNFVLYK